MSLPALPPFYSMQWTQSDGQMSAEAMMYMDDVSQTLVQAITLLNLITASSVVKDGSVGAGTVNANGIIAPSKTNAEITALEPDATVGTIWFSTTDSKLKVKTASGTIETITST